MTRFTLNDSIKQLLDLSKVPDDLKTTINENGWISHNDLIVLYKLNLLTTKIETKKAEDNKNLLEVLKGSEIYKPPKATQKKTPEYLKLMAKLRIQEQEREYRELVRGSAAVQYGKPFKLGSDRNDDYDNLTPSQQTKQMKNQLTTVFNIGISVASVGYAVWYWTGTSMRVNDGVRVLLSLFFALLVLVAEVVVFGGYLRKVEEAKVAERRKREVKKVVNTVTFGVKKEE